MSIRSFTQIMADVEARKQHAATLMEDPDLTNPAEVDRVAAEAAALLKRAQQSRYYGAWEKGIED